MQTGQGVRCFQLEAWLDGLSPAIALFFSLPRYWNLLSARFKIGLERPKYLVWPSLQMESSSIDWFQFPLWLSYYSPTSPGLLANPQGCVFRFAQMILWVIRESTTILYGSSLTLRGEFCPLIIMLCVEGGSTLHVNQVIIYNVLSPILLILRLPKQMKMAG